MTREQAKQQLIAFGIAEPTDEQITNLLNSVHGEVQKEKAKADANKAELDRLKAIEKEYEEKKNADLTAEEKYQKALKDLEDKSKASVRELNKLKAENILVAAGLKPDDYTALLDGIVTDDTEKTSGLATSLASLVKAQKDATDKAVRAELLNNTPTPDGGNNNAQTKSDAEVAAETIAKTVSASNKQAESVVGQYL